jgi:hypothetical protein
MDSESKPDGPSDDNAGVRLEAEGPGSLRAKERSRLYNALHWPSRMSRTESNYYLAFMYLSVGVPTIALFVAHGWGQPFRDGEAFLFIMALIIASIISHSGSRKLTPPRPGMVHLAMACDVHHPLFSADCVMG